MSFKISEERVMRYLHSGPPKPFHDRLAGTWDSSLLATAAPLEPLAALFVESPVAQMSFTLEQKKIYLFN